MRRKHSVNKNQTVSKARIKLRLQTNRFGSKVRIMVNLSGSIPTQSNLLVSITQALDRNPPVATGGSKTTPTYKSFTEEKDDCHPVLYVRSITRVAV